MNIPEGYALVTVEPTRTQLVAGLGTNGIHPIYCAMVSAAPPLYLEHSDLLEAIENLLWHAEQLEELIESERGEGRSSDQLYAAGEMHAYMVDAKSCIAKARGEA